LATQNLTTADAILKDLYVGPVVEQLNYKSYMIDQIERQSEFTVDHYGRKAIVPVHKSRNRGRGSRGDGGVLPTAGRQTWEDAIIPITRHYQGIELTDAAIKATASNSGAFVELLDAEVKGATKDMKKDINRQVFGTGDGLLATFGTAVTTATNTLTVDSIQYLHVGDPVDIRRKTDGDATAGVAGAEVTALVGGTTKQVTLSTTITTGSITASQYGVYLSGSRGLEMEGLQSIVSTSRTLHSINSATAGNEFWNAQVRDVGTQAANPATAGETSFELISDEVGQTGQGETEVFITTRGIRRRLADTFQSTKRFTNKEAVQIHGGYSAIMVASGAGEVPVVIDDDAPKGTVFAIDKSALRWFQQWGPGFLESPQDGTVFHLKSGSTAGSKEAIWQAWMGWYATLACVAPNRLGRLRYCTDDNPGVTA
jgi:hypothetical protein